MSTTPYELRYNIMNLARQHLLEKFYAVRDVAQTQASISESIIPLEDVQNHYPTFEQITELATQMKYFVEDKRV
jgi:hypothetical protein